jgi:dTDP-glucose pyrophosphorylase
MHQFEDIWRKAILPRTATISCAISNLNNVPLKIILVVNELGILEGTVSDGDIRRGLLKGQSLNSQIFQIMRHDPLVTPPDLERGLVLQLMLSNKILQIPIIDKKGRLVGLHLWEQVAAITPRSNLMVIMAGGIGSRLRPYTEECPKPLLRVSGKPILEHILLRAKKDGFSNFILAIHYLGYMIKDYFGSGEELGVKIDYLTEDTPLGTAGALSLLNPMPSSPFLVTNGDVITDISYGGFMDFHIRQNAAATMAVRIHETQNPYGVVQTDGIEITGFEEKPINISHINAGVYALNPEALLELKLAAICDMPSLFETLKSNGKRIIAYPMHEPWLDIGRPDDLDVANQIITTSA